MEIKIRYTFKRKADGHIWQEIKVITSIEVGFPISIILNDNELLGRDLWTGSVDKDGNEIFHNDCVKVRGTKKVGIYVTQIVFDKYFRLKENKTYIQDGIFLKNLIEKIGDIYNNPELIEK